MPSVAGSRLGRWAFPSPPFDQELLSSYLIRASLRHGLSPYRFCAFQFPGVPVWNRDIDSSAPSSFAQHLADIADVTEAQITSMQLPRPPGASASDRTWLNAVGIFHRKRKRHGLAFCPACLSEAGYFRRAWRHSAVTLCSRHAVSLLDACRRCGAPAMPHRQELDLTWCSECSADLKGMSMEPAPSGLDALQQQLWSAAERNDIEVAGTRVPGSDYLRGVRQLLPVLAKARLQRDRKAPALLKTALSTGLEHSRVGERQLLLALLAEVVEPWPDEFRRFTNVHQVAQPAFGDLARLPAWIQQEVRLLPTGHRWRYSSFTGLATIAAQLQATAATGDPLWRGMRARLLLRSLRKLRHGS